MSNAARGFATSLGFAAAALSLLLASGADAQTAQGKRAWNRFAADNGPYWRVEWSDAADQATRLRGDAAPIAGHPETVAATFLSANADVLGLRPDLSGLGVTSVRESVGSDHVTYQQSYNGLTVFNGLVDVHVKRGGQVYLVHNDAATAGSLAALPRKPTLSAADAAWHAQTAALNTPLADKRGNPLPVASADVNDGPELGIQKTRRGARLAYRVTVDDVRYVIDGMSGEVLATEAMIQYASGTGRVFDPNPVNTLNNAALRDQDDTNYAELSGAYQGKTLRNISTTGAGATLRYLLRGPYVHTFDVNATNVAACMANRTQVRKPPPQRTASTFNYNRSQSPFEHVMVYFHLDRSQRYIQSLGFPNLFNSPIRVDAHAIPDDNSFYCRSPIGAGYLAFGDGGVDDAEDADVILHEYGHALQDAASMGRYAGGAQAGAMGEGFGDYWAFSQRASGSWAPCFAEWDGDGTCLRRLDKNKKYPDDYVGQVHADGEIWSRALRDMYVKFGKTIANKLILKSHFLIAQSPNFSKGLRAILDADEALFPDDPHKNDICAIFLKRGIRSPDCGFWITMRWNNQGADVDLWLTNPAGSKCYYANLNPDWGTIGDPDDDPLLYHDCITDCVFEQITVDVLTDPGTYPVQAHYYSDHDQGASVVTMEVFSGNRRLFTGTNTLATTGNIWNAYSIIVSADEAPRVVEVNQITADPDAARRMPKK